MPSVFDIEVNSVNLSRIPTLHFLVVENSQNLKVEIQLATCIVNTFRLFVLEKNEKKLITEHI